MIPQTVKEYLDSHKPLFLEELMELLRFASISAAPEHLADCQACAEHLAGKFGKLGFSVQLLPCGQRPEKAVECFRAFVDGHTPPGGKASVTASSGARPVLIPTETPAIAAARAALKEAFAAEAVPIRAGASVPITEMIQRVLKIDPIMLGFGLPDDNLHAPNERFSLDQFHRGVLASAATMLNLGAALK